MFSHAALRVRRRWAWRVRLLNRPPDRLRSALEPQPAKLDGLEAPLEESLQKSGEMGRNGVCKAGSRLRLPVELREAREEQNASRGPVGLPRCGDGKGVPLGAGIGDDDESLPARDATETGTIEEQHAAKIAQARITVLTQAGIPVEPAVERENLLRNPQPGELRQRGSVGNHPPLAEDLPQLRHNPPGREVRLPQEVIGVLANERNRSEEHTSELQSRLHLV